MEEKITNKKEALEKLKQSGWNLHYVSNQLKCDIDVIKIAIVSEPEAIKSCPNHILQNKELILILLKEQPLIFEYLDDKLRDNYSIVMTAVRADGYLFSFASERLRGNKQIVLEAMKTSLDTLDFASKEIKEIVGSDDNFMIENVKKSISNEKFARKLNNELTPSNQPRNKVKI